MKKAVLVLLMLSTIVANAQNYSPELEGKFLPAKIIFGDGVTQDILMKYQQPEFFKNAQNKFVISRGTEKEAYEHTGGIEAFMVDNTVWVLRTLGSGKQFVIMHHQGIIEQFSYVINGKPGDPAGTKYVIIGPRTGLTTVNSLTKEVIQGEISNEKVKEWISDVPRVLEDFNLAEAESSTIDLGRIINNYNAEYEQRSFGSIKYYFTGAPVWMDLPKKAKTLAEIKAENKARLDNLYAGRATTASPEIASAKDNTPVKKETFEAKMQRIKSDGNKIGVLVNVKPVRKVMPGVQVGTEVIVEEGAYLDLSLKVTEKELVKELNEALGTTNIELIDINQIPYRESKVMGTTVRNDDFWATKYKVVFSYTLDPRLNVEQKDVSGKVKYVASLNLRSSMIVTEYIGNTTSTKLDHLAQILNMGAFVTPTVAQDEEIKDVMEVYEKTLEKLETPILEKIKFQRVDGISKVAKKFKD